MNQTPYLVGLPANNWLKLLDRHSVRIYRDIAHNTLFMDTER